MEYFNQSYRIWDPLGLYKYVEFIQSLCPTKDGTEYCLVRDGVADEDLIAV